MRGMQGAFGSRRAPGTRTLRGFAFGSSREAATSSALGAEMNQFFLLTLV